MLTYTYTTIIVIIVRIKYYEVQSAYICGSLDSSPLSAFYCPLYYCVSSMSLCVISQVQSTTRNDAQDKLCGAMYTIFLVASSTKPLIQQDTSSF